MIIQEDFKDVLNRIAILADKIDFQNFGNIFRKAISILNGEKIENIQKTFYGIYFSELPKINKLLFMPQIFLTFLAEWVPGMTALLIMHTKKGLKVNMTVLRKNF